MKTERRCSSTLTRFLPPRRCQRPARRFPAVAPRRPSPWRRCRLSHRLGTAFATPPGVSSRPIRRSCDLSLFRGRPAGFGPPPDRGASPTSLAGVAHRRPSSSLRAVLTAPSWRPRLMMGFRLPGTPASQPPVRWQPRSQPAAGALGLGFLRSYN